VLGNGNVRVWDDRVQQDVRPSELADRLREIFKSRSEQVLFLMADSNLPFQTVAEI
jgi:biopolymer transport protein ExbD